jgi:hypothetical protein
VVPQPLVAAGIKHENAPPDDAAAIQVRLHDADGQVGRGDRAVLAMNQQDDAPPVR